jgi:drug/metabolite transporter (DMT)-like permease
MLSGRLPSIGINAFRVLVGGFLVFVGALGAGYGGEIAGAPLWVTLTLWASMLIGYAGGDTAFFLGMERLGVTRAHIVSMVYPLMSTVAAIVVFGEAMPPVRVAGILFVVGGVGLIVTGTGEKDAATAREHFRGVWLVLGAALAWTLGSVMLNVPLQRVSPVAATAIQIPLAGMVLWLTPWARGTWQVVRTTRGREAVALAVICLFSAFSPLLYTVGIKHAGVAMGGVLSTTSPLFTIPLEIVVFDRWPSHRTLLGAVTTVLGIALMG